MKRPPAALTDRTTSARQPFVVVVVPEQKRMFDETRSHTQAAPTPPLPPRSPSPAIVCATRGKAFTKRGPEVKISSCETAVSISSRFTGVSLCPPENTSRCSRLHFQNRRNGGQTQCVGIKIYKRTEDYGGLQET
ncbi:hypothetical protein EYF80_059041 [Liparis tanakae]|uniref:Uncharacterized protein n=1 Tax=Liparis tanakae TaxID=230148 RepID=A0A4Z2EPD0_9TELE|nr:hypothetical protein EYF80_059041 [Liparis tanakae]